MNGSEFTKPDSLSKIEAEVVSINYISGIEKTLGFSHDDTGIDDIGIYLKRDIIAGSKETKPGDFIDMSTRGNEFKIVDSGSLSDADLDEIAIFALCRKNNPTN